MNFWEKLEKPILALAPMADVTDDAFRRIFSMYGKPAVMFTEFVSTDGLCSPGRKKLLRELQFTESQRPIVAQIWGAKPKNFFKTAQLLAEMGFDGIDINMGCPQQKEIKQGTCAALIEKPELALEIIKETKRGAGKLPVSVKTRIGLNTTRTEDWISALLSASPAAITVHARTAKELSKVPARWEEIKKAVAIRNDLGSQTLILGNGDVKSLEEARNRIVQTGADGVMIGRGAFGDPWFFGPDSQISITLQKRLRVMVEHATMFEKVFQPPKNFAVMRKHFKAYANGFPQASDLRTQLMQAENSEEVQKIVDTFLKN